MVINLIGKENYLTWEQIREMSVSGLVTFGSHTLNHFQLTDLNDGELINELEESKKIIEQKLNTSCLAFSYPKGYYNQNVVEKVRKSGYVWAFTVKEGNFNEFKHLYEVPRLSIDKSTTWSQFLGKLSGYQIIKNRI